jgi:F420-non-reducing hydrogenase iron-sulfur subunit
MVIENEARIPVNQAPNLVGKPRKPRITVFHCFTALNNTSSVEGGDYEIQGIKMPCSSISREIFLLRAFEAGADAVVVLVCPVNACRYVQGNIRTAKRVSRIKKLLDEIGIDGRRLNMFNIAQGDESAARRIIEQTVAGLGELGPNPAA